MTGNIGLALDELEPLVRAAYAAAVARDPGRSAEALVAMGDRDRDCILLATMINVHALDLVKADRHDMAPADDSLVAVASRFVTIEAWAEFDESVVLDYLRSLTDQPGDRHPVAPEVVTRLAFVMGAHLLSAYSQGPWYERLDAVLTTIESENASKG